MLNPDLLGATALLDQAATTAAAAAISRTRSRARCADQRKGSHNHQQVFHTNPPLSSVSSRPADARRADAIANRSGARRWNRRAMGQKMPGRNIGSESLVTSGRVNEEPGSRKNGRETEGTGRAAILVGGWLRLVMLALPRGRFHFCAAINLEHFEAGHLAG